MILLPLFALVLSCKKGDLDIKPDRGLLIPRSLDDLQALLDNVEVMNMGPGLAILSGDEFEVAPSVLGSYRTPAERNAYIWAKELYEGQASGDWNIGYQQVFYANVVLESLADIPRTNENAPRWDGVKGGALYFRALAHSQLVGIFADSYSSAGFQAEPGVPLKLSADINNRPPSATVAAVYANVVQELQEAAALLPAGRGVYLTRPSKASAMSILARIYLVMGNFEEAGEMADRCLMIHGDLLDYNELSLTSTRPLTFAKSSAELLSTQFVIGYSFASSAGTGMSPELLGIYEKGDLRKGIFFRDRGNGLFTFKGNYSGTSSLFSGTTTAEMLLVRAESSARAGELQNALSDVNLLRSKRFSKATGYVPLNMTDQKGMLDIVLLERRRELVTRGLRWTDLKRLNREPGRETVITRRLNNMEYVLAPNSKAYVFPIPQEEIDGSGIPQNIR